MKRLDYWEGQSLSDPTVDEGVLVSTESERDEELSLDWDRYKLQVTGLPGGIRHLVQDPATGFSFVYDGVLDGALVFIVSSLERGDDPTRNGTLEDLVEFAQWQDEVRNGLSVRWYVQHQADASQIEGMLAREGITSITVIYEPATVV